MWWKEKENGISLHSTYKNLFIYYNYLSSTQNRKLTSVSAMQCVPHKNNI